MKKVYLVLTRHIVNQTKRSIVWSEWYVFSCDDCFESLDEALERVNELRSVSLSKNYDFVDYRIQTLFLH